MKTVCLLGSSSGRNAGDAALIGAIMHDLDMTLQVPLRYEVSTTNPKYLKKYYSGHLCTSIVNHSYILLSLIVFHGGKNRWLEGQLN